MPFIKEEKVEVIHSYGMEWDEMVGKEWEGMEFKEKKTKDVHGHRRCRLLSFLRSLARPPSVADKS